LSRFAVSCRHQPTAEPSTCKASTWRKNHPTTVIKQQGTEPGLLASHAMTGANHKLIATAHICQRTVQSIRRQSEDNQKLIYVHYPWQPCCCHDPPTSTAATGVAAQHLSPCCLGSAALGAAPDRSTAATAAAAPPVAAAAPAAPAAQASAACAGSPPV